MKGMKGNALQCWHNGGSPPLGYDVDSDRGRRYHYYECGKRDRTRSCDNSRIRKHILEEIVIREIEDNIFSDHVLSKVKQKLIIFLNQYQEDRQGELDYLLPLT
ncbi:MAG: zinc ribbon domain-containing protein [Peptococcaceae bacterium]|nr:zinc ribbon domain-containing protein [Peptococcaceae bacterium]